MKPIVLVADDDPSILEILKLGFRSKGYEVITACDGKSAIQAIEQSRPDLLVLDIEMPGLTGIEVLRHLRKDWPALPVVIMTAHGTISLAVEAMKEGATEFITKPFEMEQLLLVIQKALEREGLRREVEVLRNEVDSRYETISSVNTEMLRVLTTAQKAAQSDATILLLGESGVGKDLFARCIHAWSPRRNKIFTPVSFMQAQYAAGQQGIEQASQAIGALAPADGAADKKWWQLDRHIQQLGDTIDQTVEHAIRLIVVFLLQTLILPLAVFWILLRSGRMLTAAETGN